MDEPNNVTTPTMYRLGAVVTGLVTVPAGALHHHRIGSELRANLGVPWPSATADSKFAGGLCGAVFAATWVASVPAAVLLRGAMFVGEHTGTKPPPPLR